MSLYLAAFAVFGLVVAAMAVGVILGDLRIKGSCGGLANLRTEDGQPMCECGARPGQPCGADAGRRFESTTDEGPAPPAPRSTSESVAV